ncbi:MAG TPA: TIR domain-containing protein [Bacilli bacterium]|jgi:hypothetical protein|nr:TIR domain-containing protein [Bacilli bacterium]HNZ74311.1 TIR domain-containing protein [Bacilli bacterium]HPA98789.1 TIR domain-containing protein [Bacilli bacterium]HQM18058.1 TIR domain-containing protein [Bacilli bacterium]HQO93931.1 TIR domain-containing protein [Bacilli bacterium]
MIKKIFVVYDEEDQEHVDKIKNYASGTGKKYELIDCLALKENIGKVDDEELKKEFYQKMDEAEIAVIIMSQAIRSMRKYISWQVTYLANEKKPLVCVNTNGIRSVDSTFLPAKLKRGALSLHIPLNKETFNMAIDNWPRFHEKFVAEGKNGMFKFPESIYKQMKGEKKD